MTYRASQLHPTVLASAEAIVATRESDPNEVTALSELCASCRTAGKAIAWPKLLGGMVLGDAVVLPMTQEAEGEVRHIHLAPRLTPHVRHAAKYIDIPVPAGRAFVFGGTAGVPATTARTLREFVFALEQAPAAVLENHLRRGDFSKWVADVFGDYPLAATLRGIEREFRRGRVNGVLASLGQAVRARYEFMELEPAPTA